MPELELNCIMTDVVVVCVLVLKLFVVQCFLEFKPIPTPLYYYYHYGLANKFTYISDDQRMSPGVDQGKIGPKHHTE